MIGGISVSVTTGLGAAIVATVMGYNQVGYGISKLSESVIVADVWWDSLNTGLCISSCY